MRLPQLVIIAVLVATSAIAQQQGSITGVVRDATGKALPGVTVVVAAGPQESNERRPVVTDAQGRFIIDGLALGSYTLSFRLAGFASMTMSGVVATAIAPTAIEAVLRVGPLPDAQTVRLAPPLLPFPQQPLPDARGECHHGVNETDAERERRRDAFATMRLIYSILQQVPADGRGFPDWPTLSRSTAVAALQKAPGPTGELANRIQWGSFEPLPGWRLTYVPGITVTYSLRDMNDPCWFTLSSNDPQVIPPTARTMPLS